MKRRQRKFQKGGFQKELEKLIKEYNLVPAQVYNTVETALFYKMLSSKSAEVESESAALDYK